MRLTKIGRLLARRNNDELSPPGGVGAIVSNRRHHWFFFRRITMLGLFTWLLPLWMIFGDLFGRFLVVFGLGGA